MSSSEQPTLQVQGAEASKLVARARAAGWQVLTAPAPEGVPSYQTALLAVNLPGAEALEELEKLRRTHPWALVVAPRLIPGVDLVLRGTESSAQLDALLQHAREHWHARSEVHRLAAELDLGRRRTQQLADIGIALSSRQELPGLLEAILTEARRLAHCDAGSLYLIERERDGGAALVFKLAQNDSIQVPLVESRLPISAASLAGYVALTGMALNLDDAYCLPPGAPYYFNRSFDEKMGYRTRSLFVLPMRDHRDRVVGVLQFINHINPVTGAVEPFGWEIRELLRAVASQAAVSIQKNTLIADMNELFESFVYASVKTIEQRDPTTSGHSLRVADKTVALLGELPRSGLARFRHLELTPQRLREVRYAALLHDFGKIGVQESILVKSHKLPADRLELIRYRIELHKERLRRQAVERELALLHEAGMEAPVAIRRVHRELVQELSRLDEFFGWIKHANLPNVMEAGDYEHLRTLREYEYQEIDGSRGSLIDDGDLMALSVRRGSLTPEERQVIQTHVIHTRDFLETLPWPPELAGVPAIAGAHHEKLDGSGYPYGLRGEDIPLPSRVMTICDIYDALTAMDRPYKSAMSPDRALEILGDEARAGLIDGDILKVFINARIYLLDQPSARVAV